MWEYQNQQCLHVAKSMYSNCLTLNLITLICTEIIQPIRPFQKKIGTKGRRFFKINLLGTCPS